MNVSHKDSEFRSLFLGNKGKTKLAEFQNMCTTPIYIYIYIYIGVYWGIYIGVYIYSYEIYRGICIFLRKIEQISDSLLISLNSGWSDLKPCTISRYSVEIGWLTPFHSFVNHGNYTATCSVTIEKTGRQVDLGVFIVNFALCFPFYD